MKKHYESLCAVVMSLDMANPILAGSVAEKIEISSSDVTVKSLENGFGDNDFMDITFE